MAWSKSKQWQPEVIMPLTKSSENKNQMHQILKFNFIPIIHHNYWIQIFWNFIFHNWIREGNRLGPSVWSPQDVLVLFVECRRQDKIQWRHQKYFCEGHRRGKMHFTGGKNPKKLPKKADFDHLSFWRGGGGGKWGKEPLNGGGQMPPCPPWCHHW